ncbi:MAG: 16S rRNA (cytidine(1402)-2'-O)-methyltransferase [Candidatus Peribacteraceae bacterium]|nr:16S rRNA (cytidine(1402)-2'-O)-methyltransferase [Candidatus Peribacteraceae bacterium]
MLSVIATPIGNLGDITLRAIETLKKTDAVICEDTRVTGNLLKQLNIQACHGEPRRTMARGVSPFDGAQGDTPKKELISLHGYSDEGKIAHILGRLQRGEHLALVSDAGTPGISDPGFVIVSRARDMGIAIESIPGPSAFLTALSVSGLPIHQFLYLGFLPLKKGRKTLLDSFRNEERTIVFYESVHRIEKTLNELAEALKEQPDRKVVVARELTKMHEEILSTTVAGLPSLATNITKKGEFVVVVGAQ